MGNHKNTSSKKQGNNNTTDNTTDYRYSPKVETPDPKAVRNKTTDKESK